MELLTDPRTDLPEHLLAFAAMHDAMLRDAGRLEHVARATADRDDRRLLAAWWDRLERTIVHHHQREDDLVWPVVVAADPTFAEDRTALEADHHELDRCMERVRHAVHRPGDGDLAPAATRFSEVLTAHLAREEAVAFPRLRHVPGDAYRALEQRMAREGTLRDAAFELPWVLDGASPAHAAAVRDIVPSPMWVLHRAWWQRSYRRTSAPVLAMGR